MIQRYTHSVLTPQLRSLGLTKRQRDIVVGDVTMRLESLLSHWSDEAFRRTVLVLGAEEASFWEPQGASLEIRSLVVVTVRNSLLTDLNASHAYTKALRSLKELLPDERMPWITGEAIEYFRAVNLDAVRVRSRSDTFGSLPRRFPNAWHVLSLLASSPETEVTCALPAAEGEAMGFVASGADPNAPTIIDSGIDHGFDPYLADALRKIQRREIGVLFSSSLKGITRNPEKLLFVIDHILRCGGAVLTPNYLLSPTYLARRSPFLRPAHFRSELPAQVANPAGLSEPHREALLSLGL